MRDGCRCWNCGAHFDSVPKVGGPPEDKPPLVTERAAVLRERAAWIAGCDTGINSVKWPQNSPVDPARMVEKIYPLPTKRVTRPRVVKDPHSPGYQWRVEDGNVKFFGSDQKWMKLDDSAVWLTQSRFTVITELLANPTETVVVDDTGD